MRYFPKAYSPPTTAPSVDLRRKLNRLYLSGRISFRAYAPIWGAYFNGKNLEQFEELLSTGEAINAPGIGVKSLAELQGLFLEREVTE